MNRNFLIYGFLFLLLGCTEEEQLNPEVLGLKYYPLQAGNFWIYQVTETRYKDQFADEATDSTTYLVRERIDTVYQDLTGADTYKFTRSRRQNESEEWSQDSVFVVNKSASDVRIMQNNRRVVAFIFPVMEGKKWNAHIFNSHSSVNNPAEVTFYSYANVGQSLRVNGINYPNTVQVNHVVNNNAIEQQDLHEVYGYGIGRVLKKKLFYQYCSDPDRQNGCEIGNQFIINGFKITEQLIQHGSLK